MLNELTGTSNVSVSQTPASANLFTVVYRSRAVVPLSDQDLQCLMQTAQARNHAEGITGVVLYDDNHFFQWLEGPEEGIERVMDSIRCDRRHTDLEVLSHRTSPARQFYQWDMKLAARGANPALWRGDVLEPPREIIDDLRRQPTAAPKILLKLIPLPAAVADSPLATSLRGNALSSATAAILKDAFLTIVVPLLHGHRPPEVKAEQAVENRCAAELADLLVASDQAASLDLIRELRGKNDGTQHLFASLFEPAARSLGNLWNNDLCTEFEVTLGLCRLQTAVRLLGVDAPRPAPCGLQPKVLIAPVPGEPHQFVAALDSEWLASRGWLPQLEFPSDDRSLADLLSSTWVDVLDLSLSAAFRREDRLPRLTRTVTEARRASRNPALVVVVGGRVFVEEGLVGADVGADMASATSVNVDRRIMDGVIRFGEARPNPSGRQRR